MADLWAFVIVTLFAILVLVWGLCAAASDADDEMEELFRQRALDELEKRRRVNR